MPIRMNGVLSINFPIMTAVTPKSIACKTLSGEEYEITFTYNTAECADTAASELGGSKESEKTVVLITKLVFFDIVDDLKRQFKCTDVTLT